MIPPRLTRLKIADLVCELPGDLTLRDPELLELHLGPFAWDGPGKPDVVVEQVDRVPPAAELPPGSYRIDVNRTPGMAEDALYVRACRVADAGPGLRVGLRLASSLDVSAGLHVGLAQQLPRRGGLMLHASSVQAEGLGIVFPGPSECGKSTAAGHFPPADRLTDERCIVHPVPGGWRAASAPMWGTAYQPVRAASVPLGEIVLVERHLPPGVKPVARVDGVRRLAAGVVHHRYDPAGAARVLSALASLASSVPMVEVSYRLGEPLPSLLLAERRRRGAGAGAFQGVSA